jgi:hypothetical protein
VLAGAAAVPAGSVAAAVPAGSVAAAVPAAIATARVPAAATAVILERFEDIKEGREK